MVLQTHLEELRVLDWPDHHLLNKLLGMVLIHRSSVNIISTVFVEKEWVGFVWVRPDS